MSNVVSIYSDKSQFAELLQEKFHALGFSTLLNYSPNTKNNALLGYENVYSLFVVDQLTHNNIQEKDEQIKKYLRQVQLSNKSLFVFPYSNSQEVKNAIYFWKKQILTNDTGITGILYLGDPVVKESPIRFGLLYKKIHQATLFPTDEDWACSEIVKLTFSMKAYGQTTAVIGGGIRFGLDTQGADSELARESNVFSVDCDQTIVCPTRVSLRAFVAPNENSLALPQVSENLIGLVDNNETTVPVVKPIVATVKKIAPFNIVNSIFKKIKIRKIILGGTSVLLIYLSLPTILYMMSLLSVRLISTGFFTNRPSLSTYLIKPSHFLATNSLNLSVNNKQLAVLNFYYSWQSHKSTQTLEIIEDAFQLNKINLEALQLVKKTVLGDVSDSWSMYDRLATEVNFLQANLGFSQAQEGDYERYYGSTLFGRKKIVDIRRALNSLDIILGNMPELLGQGGIKKYAVLLGNETELKGSAGRTKGIAIYEIAGGQINSVSVYDSKEITELINGKVDPPGDFKNYHNNDNWSMSEVGWYSDFSQIARDTAWFIEIALGEKVDGVVSLNDAVIQELAKFPVGELQIEVTTHGTSNELVDKFILSHKVLFNEENYKNNKLIFKVIELLQSKKIQVYFDNTKVKAAVENLGWAANLKLPVCNTNCYSDLIGEWEIAESEGRENINKEIDLDIQLNEGILKKRLTLFVKNGNVFDYRAVFRVAAPIESGFAPITVVTASEKKTVEGFTLAVNGFKENSIRVTLKPNQTTGISFYWEQPFQNMNLVNSYVLRFVKQPWTQKKNLSITLGLLPEAKLEVQPHFSLTNDGKYSYNTELTSDLTTEIKFVK